MIKMKFVSFLIPLCLLVSSGFSDSSQISSDSNITKLEEISKKGPDCTSDGWNHQKDIFIPILKKVPSISWPLNIIKMVQNGCFGPYYEHTTVSNSKLLSKAISDFPKGIKYVISITAEGGEDGKLNTLSKLSIFNDSVNLDWYKEKIRRNNHLDSTINSFISAFINYKEEYSFSEYSKFDGYVFSFVLNDISNEKIYIIIVTDPCIPDNNYNNLWNLENIFISIYSEIESSIGKSNNYSKFLKSVLIQGNNFTIGNHK
jgi:hypothetical protein